PLPSLYQIVDQMVAVKLNVLHLHLTDDQGWRFEVKRYPKLTELGACRAPPSTGGPAPATRVGGFYTQAELRDLVRYAAERGITI
ncbi:family 20 glycosylhydrolase, partial [Listeria monocytogenes]|nr:family 20 glycosylhydrolase [Listeria monocytogenes]